MSKKAFVLRLEQELFDGLAAEAASHRQSLNSYFVSLLSDRGGSSQKGALQNLIEKIRTVYGERLEGLVLFGSVARGTQTASSDLDLLLVFEASQKISSLTYKEWDQNFDLAEFDKISPHFVQIPKDPLDVGSLWLEVALEGKVLSEKNDKISNFLRTLRSCIAEGRFVRAHSYGVPYWKKVA